jgi:hypothetical protein
MLCSYSVSLCGDGVGIQSPIFDSMEPLTLSHHRLSPDLPWLIRFIRLRHSCAAVLLAVCDVSLKKATTPPPKLQIGLARKQRQDRSIFWEFTLTLTSSQHQHPIPRGGLPVGVHPTTIANDFQQYQISFHSLVVAHLDISGV